MFDTNVLGLINMTQAIMPIYKSRPDGGRGDIINIGSIAGREPYPGGSIYCATKAAVRSFTDALRRELIASRVRVMEVDPGQVETVYFDGFSFLGRGGWWDWRLLMKRFRSFRLSGFMGIRLRRMRFMREFGFTRALACRVLGGGR